MMPKWKLFFFSLAATAFAAEAFANEREVLQTQQQTRAVLKAAEADGARAAKAKIESLRRTKEMAAKAKQALAGVDQSSSAEKARGKQAKKVVEDAERLAKEAVSLPDGRQGTASGSMSKSEVDKSMSDPSLDPQGVTGIDAEALARAMPSLGFDLKAFSGNGGLDLDALAESYRADAEVQAEKRLYSVMSFVSLNMPKTSLMKLNRDLAKVNGLMVFRGVKGKLTTASWNETMETLKTVAAGGGDIQINPALFKKYSIAVAPTLILTTDPDGDDGCSDRKCAAKVGRVLGDVTVDFAFGILQKSGGDVGKLAEQNLKLFSRGRQ